MATTKKPPVRKKTPLMVQKERFVQYYNSYMDTIGVDGIARYNFSPNEVRNDIALEKDNQFLLTMMRDLTWVMQKHAPGCMGDSDLEDALIPVRYPYRYQTPSNASTDTIGWVVHTNTSLRTAIPVSTEEAFKEYLHRSKNWERAFGVGNIAFNWKAGISANNYMEWGHSARYSVLWRKNSWDYIPPGYNTSNYRTMGSILYWVDAVKMADPDLQDEDIAPIIPRLEFLGFFLYNILHNARNGHYGRLGHTNYRNVLVASPVTAMHSLISKYTSNPHYVDIFKYLMGPEFLEYAVGSRGVSREVWEEDLSFSFFSD